MMLDDSKREKLIRLGRALIDQERAHTIVPALQPGSGYWFGGGNMIEDADGTLYLTGRYRAPGDARAGLSAGERGLELAIYASHDRGRTFTKLLSFAKADLGARGRQVISIEGSALHLVPRGVELFVSSEKTNIGYPAPLESFLKPGTGVWTIERIQAPTIAGLAQEQPETIMATRDPRFLHVKDPVIYDAANGDTVLGFCTHPFSWASSNSAFAVRRAGARDFEPPDFTYFRRGYTWDVAISRVTCLLRVPRRGTFAAGDDLVLAFYDGGESMRNLDEHAQAVKRARGYSCEEIGGLAVAPEADLRGIERLSVNQPLFVSPHGTGCSRYVSVLAARDGLYATWQQSQPDLSQPLVMNVMTWEEAEALLT
jgi:hypothetical protein